MNACETGSAEKEVEKGTNEYKHSLMWVYLQSAFEALSFQAHLLFPLPVTFPFKQLSILDNAPLRMRGTNAI